MVFVRSVSFKWIHACGWGLPRIPEGPRESLRVPKDPQVPGMSSPVGPVIHRPWVPRDRSGASWVPWGILLKALGAASQCFGETRSSHLVALGLLWDPPRVSDKALKAVQCPQVKFMTIRSIWICKLHGLVEVRCSRRCKMRGTATKARPACTN